MKTTKITIIMYLVLSLVFIVPMMIADVSAEDEYPIKQDSGDKTKSGDVAETCSLGPPNVKDSLILSAVMMCIPGIIEKVDEWRNIECQEAVCAYEAVSNSLDPGFCSKQASYQVCTYVMGDVFALPPMAILEYLRDMIASALANPVGIAYGVAVFFARKTIKGCAATKTCNSASMKSLNFLLGINDVLAVVQTFKSMMKNGLGGLIGQSGESYCEQLPGIIEELEKIVNEEEVVQTE